MSFQNNAVNIYRRAFDRQYAVDVFLPDPLHPPVVTESPTDASGNIPEHLFKRWITVGVFRSFIPAKKCAKGWRRKMNDGLNAAIAHTGVSSV